MAPLPSTAGLKALPVELGKSYSDYNHPQRFVASWVYDLPLGQTWITGKRWKKLAQRWELTGISTFEAGPPRLRSRGLCDLSVLPHPASR